MAITGWTIYEVLYGSLFGAVFLPFCILNLGLFISSLFSDTMHRWLPYIAPLAGPIVSSPVGPPSFDDMEKMMKEMSHRSDGLHDESSWS